MCGYCDENILFGIKEALASGPPWSEIISYFRQYEAAEEPRGLTTRLACEYLCQESDVLSNAFHLMSDEEAELVSFNTLLCRIIEVIETEGVNSQEYHLLITNKFVLEAIDWHECLTKKHEELLQEFGVKRLQKSIVKEAFLCQPTSHHKMNSNEMSKECRSIITTYLDYMAHGDGLSIESLNVIFPFVLISIFRLQADTPYLKKIISSNPSAPFLEAHELWLQRKALQLLVKNHGIDPVLSLIPRSIRLMLIYYLTNMIGLSLKERSRVVERIHLFREGIDGEVSLQDEFEEVILKQRKIFSLLPETKSEIDDELWAALANDNLSYSNKDIDLLLEDLSWLENGDVPSFLRKEDKDGVSANI